MGGKVVLRVLWHAIIVLSIGTSGMSVLVSQFMMHTIYGQPVSWVQLFMGSFCVVFSLVNLYNFKLSETKVLR